MKTVEVDQIVRLPHGEPVKVEIVYDDGQVRLRRIEGERARLETRQGRVARHQPRRPPHREQPPVLVRPNLVQVGEPGPDERRLVLAQIVRLGVGQRDIRDTALVQP